MEIGKSKVRKITKKPAHNGLAFHLRFHQIYPDLQLIPGATFEYSTCPLLLYATPLLEEKWGFGTQTLIPNIHDPLLHDRSRACHPLSSFH